MVLSMLSGLQDPIGPYSILRNGSIGLFQITIWTTHLKKGISVSDNEIACNWLLKKIYNTHWHLDRILQDLDRILPKILIGSYQGLLIAEIDFFQLKMWSRYLHRGCLLPILWIQWVLSLWVSVKYILLCNSFCLQLYWVHILYGGSLGW